MAKSDRIEIFCNEIIKGKSQRQAYYAAYPAAKKWQEKSVDNRASELAKSSEVLARLGEMRAEAENDNKITRNDVISQLKELGFTKIDKKKIKAADKIKALELMVRMLGYDKPSKDDTDRLDEVLKRIEGEI